MTRAPWPDLFWPNGFGPRSMHEWRMVTKALTCASVEHGELLGPRPTLDGEAEFVVGTDSLEWVVIINRPWDWIVVAALSSGRPLWSSFCRLSDPE